MNPRLGDVHGVMDQLPRNRWFERPQVHSGRSAAVVAWCAVASLGLLFVEVSDARERGAAMAHMRSALVDYTTLVVLVVPLGALVAWQLFPRRSWAWLLLAGAVCTVPLRGIEFAPRAYSEWMSGPLTILVLCGPVFTLVGVLGAATVVWQAGRRAVGAALVGAVLVVGLVGTVVIVSIAGQSPLLRTPPALSVVSLILALVAIAGAIVGVVAGAPSPAVRPRWRVTVAAGVVAASQVVAYLWQPDLAAVEEAFTRPDALGDYYLQRGLVFVAIGLVGGAVAGLRPLMTSAAAGLMLGAFAMLVLPATEVLELPVLAVIVVVGALLAGLAAGLSRWRARIGVVGLAATALGLVPLSFLFNSDLEYDSYEGFVIGATPVLLVIGIIAAVAALSSLGAEHAATAATPAVLGALTTGFVLGTVAIVNFVSLEAPQDKTSIAGLLPSVTVVLLVAAGLVGAVTVARRRAEPPTEPVQVSQS